MKIGSLFTGYGGLDMATESAFGATTAWVSDIDKGACKVLAHRYPDVPNLGDITKVDWSTVEYVDIMTGGSPCQDLSHAGRRAGMTKGTRSNLWVTMREAIAQLRPSYVIWENVRGAYSAAADSDVVVGERLLARGSGAVHLRALGRVLGDLSDLGFDAEWRGVQASDVGAPHGRFRVFVIARAVGAEPFAPQPPRALAAVGTGDLLLPTPRTINSKSRRAMSSSVGNGRRTGGGQSSPPGLDEITSMLAGMWPAHMPSAEDLPPAMRALLPTPAVNDMGKAYTPDEWDAWTERMKAEHGNGNGHGKSLEIEAARLLPTPGAALGEGGQTSRSGDRKDEKLLSGIAEDIAHERFGPYAEAIARWESITRPAPSPTEPTGRGGAHRLSSRFTEWMMGVADGWITDVPDITRNEGLKLAGNGVVPQQAHAAIVDALTAFEVVAA